MNAHHDTQYIADGASPVVTLAQSRANQIEQRLETDLRHEVERITDEITAKTEQLHSNWATHANDPQRASALQARIGQLHSDRDLARALVAGAEAELEAAQRQVIADKLLAHRAAVDKALSARVDLGRQLVDFAVGMVAQYRQLSTMGHQVAIMFSDDRSATGITMNDASSMLDRKDLQGDLELVFESLLPQQLWNADRPPFAYPKGTHNRLIETLDAERLAVLMALDKAIGQVTSSGTLGETGGPDVHAQSLAAAQRRAASEAA